MTCSTAGCSGGVVARGLCGRHYKQWQRAGRPDGPPQAERSPKGRCAEAGCDGEVYARDHCSRHYRRLLRNGYVTPDRAPRDCEVSGCGRKAVTRGYCHGHYLRLTRQGDVRADVPLSRPVNDTCTVPDCDRGAHSAKYCRSHYKRYKLYGDPLAGGPIRTVTGDGCISHGYWWMRVRPNQRHLVPDDRPAEFEHRLVMAEVLGRPLTDEEVVHHRDGDRLNNTPENLELWSTAQPKGQRVEDKLMFAWKMIELYRPDVAQAFAELALDVVLRQNDARPTPG